MNVFLFVTSLYALHIIDTYSIPCGLDVQIKYNEVYRCLEPVSTLIGVNFVVNLGYTCTIKYSSSLLSHALGLRLPRMLV